MLPYWLMFALWAIGAVLTERRRERGAWLFFIAATITTILMIGLRYQVGGDWGAYMRIYENIYFLSLPASMTTTDPGYAAINWFAARTGLGISFVNLCSAALFMGGFARLAWKQPNPPLAVLVAVPYLIIVVAMGYTRQAAAIGIICFAIADVSERHLLRLVILIGVAALFHKTAILILPIALVPIFRRNALFGAAGGLMFILLFALLLRDTSDQMLNNYVQSDYDSQGALIRVAMNVLPAAMFLLLRSRIELPPFQKSFWTTCAILALVSVVALRLASATSGIDRLSLYLIPLQSVVYARLPLLLGRGDRALPSIMLSVMGYAFLVQFVWLNYAENAGYWIPYTMGVDLDGTVRTLGGE